MEAYDQNIDGIDNIGAGHRRGSVRAFTFPDSAGGSEPVPGEAFAKPLQPRRAERPVLRNRSWPLPVILRRTVRGSDVAASIQSAAEIRRWAKEECAVGDGWL